MVILYIKQIVVIVVIDRLKDNVQKVSINKY